MTKCVQCGNETGSKSKYCSVACRSKYFREKGKSSQSNIAVTNSEPEKDSEPVNREPKPIETFTRFDGERVPLTEFEIAREGYDKLVSLIFGKKAKKQNPQSTEEIRQPTATELAFQRENELNRGRFSSTINYESAQRSFEPSQNSQLSQNSQISKPANRAPNWIDKLRQRFAPKQEEEEFPARPVNEYGMPLSNYKCLTERRWVGHSERALCDYRGHSLEYVP